MLGNKPMRKNRFKKSSKPKHSRILQNCALCFKIISGTSFIALMGIFFIFCYSLITQCDYFRVKDLRIEGIRMLSAEQVLKQAELDKNMNLLSVNLSLTRKKLISHPWIANAEIKRTLPDKIVIKITEHIPLAVLNLGHKFIINDKGRIFKKLTDRDPFDLPEIDGLKLSDISLPDEHKSIPFDAIINVLQLGKSYEGFLCYGSIKKIKVDRELGLTIFTATNGTDHPKKIKLGYYNYPEKFNKLEKVIFFLKENPVFSDFNSINLVNLNRIVVNPVIAEPSLCNIEKEI